MVKVSVFSEIRNILFRPRVNGDSIFRYRNRIQASNLFITLGLCRITTKVSYQTVSNEQTITLNSNLISNTTVMSS